MKFHCILVWSGKAEGAAVISGWYLTHKGAERGAESLVRCRTPSVLTATGSSSWLPRLCCLDSKQAKLRGSLKIMQIMQRALKPSPCWILPRLCPCSWSCTLCWGKTVRAGGCRGGAAPGTPLPAALLGRNLLFPACCTPGKILLGAAA